MALTSAEKNFINSFKNELHINEIKKLQSSIESLQLKSFDKVQTLATLIGEAYEWYQAKGREALKNLGGKMNIETFIGLYGLSKSYFYKLVKVGNISALDVANFEAECDKIEATGYKPVRGVDGLLSYMAKKEKIVVSDTKTEAPKVATKVAPIISVNLHNICFKVYEDIIDMKQDISIDDVQIAIDKLMSFKRKIESKAKKDAKLAHKKQAHELAL